MRRLKRRYKHSNRKKKLKIFYINLALFVFCATAMIIGIILKYRIEGNWSSLLIVIASICVWILILILQGWKVFGSGFLFNENWEEHRMKEYLKDEQETLWE